MQWINLILSEGLNFKKDFQIIKGMFSTAASALCYMNELRFYPDTDRMRSRNCKLYY